MYPDSSPTRSCIKLRSDVVLEPYNPRRQKHRCVLLLWICLRNREAMHYVWLRWHAIQTHCLCRTPAETGWDHFLRCIFLESRQVLCETPTLGASNVSLLNSNLFLNPGLSGGCVCVCVFSVLIGSEHQQMASGVLCWCRTSRYRLLSSGPGSSQPFVVMLSLPAQDKVISLAKDSSRCSSLFNEQPAMPCPVSPSLSATAAPAPGHCPQLCYSVAAFTSEPGCCVGQYCAGTTDQKFARWEQWTALRWTYIVLFSLHSDLPRNRNSHTFIHLVKLSVK